MGRTVLPFTQELHREEESWKSFRRAVRELSRRVDELARGPVDGHPKSPGGK